VGTESERGFVTSLRSAGFVVLPAPRQVDLSDEVMDVLCYRLVLSDVAEDDIAVDLLMSVLEEEAINADGNPEMSAALEHVVEIELAVRPGTVDTATADARDEQAYCIEINEDRVSLAGNGRPGLFYAVQTLLQLLEGDGVERGILPVGRIVDWPQYGLRCLHWDTKHHQDRMDTLKRFLDEAARFKVNGILFELEDKFEYPSHPIIGAPGAFTTAELQDLVDYGLERHIQIIPDVQSPAHLCYVLKHEQFAHLRCDGSNYQACMDKPEVRNLLFAMYDDVCEATKGVTYFHVSTDEVYYAGICETVRTPYNPENRSLTWVDYVNAAHEHLTKKGREVIVWAEYPLLPTHIPLLPPTLINGVAGRKPDQTRLENEHGIRQFTYVSMQGAETMFPSYFTFDGRHGVRSPGRLEMARADTMRGWKVTKNTIGTISAAWDDTGIHNECFWLGWAMMGQASWTPGLPVEQVVADFCDLFYGREASEMPEIYRDLQAGARFVESVLERLPSKVRGPGYGYSDEKKPVPRGDRTLVPPALPNPDDLSIAPVFRVRYANALGEARQRLADNDRLLLRLQQNLSRVRRNRYNLEVYLSVGYLQRHFIEMLLGVAEAEDLLVSAAEAAGEAKPERAVNLMVDARDKVQAIIDGLYDTYGRVKTVWEKSRFEKGRSVDGRDFVHIMDDVKDHSADRRPDLSYLIQHEEHIGLPDWVASLQKVIDTYAAAQGLTVAGSEEEHLDE